MSRHRSQEMESCCCRYCFLQRGCLNDEYNHDCRRQQIAQLANREYSVSIKSVVQSGNAYVFEFFVFYYFYIKSYKNYHTLITLFGHEGSTFWTDLLFYTLT